jgi:tetratricopeptide (TPR) repeat protein
MEAPAEDDRRLSDLTSPLDLVPTFRGSLGVTPFAQLLSELSLVQLTGTLTLFPDVGEPEDVRVVFSEGIPVAAQLPFACDDLAEGLLRLFGSLGSFVFHEWADLTDPASVTQGVVDPEHLVRRAAQAGLLPPPGDDAESSLHIVIEHDSVEFLDILDDGALAEPLPAPLSWGKDLVVIDPYEETLDDYEKRRSASVQASPGPALELPSVLDLEAVADEAGEVPSSGGEGRAVDPRGEVSPETPSGLEIDEAKAPLRGWNEALASRRGRSPTWSSRGPSAKDAAAARLGFEDAGRLVDAGRLDQAACRLTAVLRLDPTVAAYHLALASVLMRRFAGQRMPQERILAALDQTLRLDERCAEAHYLKGLVLQRRRELARGLAHLRRAVAIAPRHAAAVRALEIAERPTGPLRRLMRGTWAR